MLQDNLIDAIERGYLTQSNLTLQRLRSISQQSGLHWHDELAYGRAIPAHTGHLDQYLWSYGKMVAAQWGVVREQVRDCLQTLDVCTSTPLHLYDYGAGQGLSTMHLIDALDLAAPKGQSWQIDHLLQLDPSQVALCRAAALARCWAPEIAQVHSQHGFVSQAGHLLARAEALHIHVFSNAIDVEDFDYPRMIGDALAAQGQHLFVVVSSDRNCFGGTPQVSHAHRLIAQGAKAQLWDSGMHHFVCNGGMKAVSFVQCIETH